MRGIYPRGERGSVGKFDRFSGSRAPSHLSIFSAASHLLEKDHNISQNDKKSYFRTNQIMSLFFSPVTGQA